MKKTQDTLFTDERLSARKVLYTPSEFAKCNLLHLIETGITECHKSYKSVNHGYKGWLLIFVERGSGKFVQNGKKYNLKSGDVVFTTCSIPYEHQSSGKDLWTIKYLSFDGPFMNGILEEFIERGGKTVFSTSKPAEYSKLLDEVYNCSSITSYVRDMVLNEKMASLLTLLMEDSWNKTYEEKEVKANICDDVKIWLDKNYRNQMNLEELAQKFNINKFYLSRVFKDKFGTTIIDYVTVLRITQAKRLLRFSDKPLKEIAENCGFIDLNYFVRVFKKLENIPPGKYKKVWKK